jgi:hypothetical protein
MEGMIMVLKRIGAFSCGKILGALYAVIGLIIGAVITLISLFGAALTSALGANPPPDMPGGPVIAVVIGVGAIILMPIIYGLLGFFSGLIGALIYNVMARMVGGVKLELE